MRGEGLGLQLQLEREEYVHDVQSFSAQNGGPEIGIDHQHVVGGIVHQGRRQPVRLRHDQSRGHRINQIHCHGFHRGRHQSELRLSGHRRHSVLEGQGGQCSGSGTGHERFHRQAEDEKGWNGYRGRRGRFALGRRRVRLHDGNVRHIGRRLVYLNVFHQPSVVSASLDAIRWQPNTIYSSLDIHNAEPGSCRLSEARNT